MDFFADKTPLWYALAILFLPLAGFLFNAVTFKTSFTRTRGHFVPLLCMGAALVCSLAIFKHAVLEQEPPAEPVAESATGHGPEHASWEWWSTRRGWSFSLLRAGDLEIDAGITIDALTATMLVVVTIVAFLVHLYSVGYMHGDPRFSRFFAFLQLFTFSMLGLVLTDNLLLLFCFWELVGVCSYFLIGFWFEQDEPPKASIKAFMTNRFGDVGFLIGILFVWRMFRTLDLHGIADSLRSIADGNAALPALFGWEPKTALTVAGLLLFTGAMAKSAQVPLHVWLPDAMAGPTPVSALIHAATMVAAGVYMVGRMYFFFTPPVLAFIAIIGTITAILAASIGLVHDNIKKVLAYSTCSQLGYMMLALGVGGYSAGLFHLYTHAFFKACLFLGAGSVIHAVHTEDMRQMGGLRSRMPVTYWTMFLSTLALAGAPPLSGAFSKELIVEHALQWGIHGNVAQWLPALVAIFGAGLTFFYMLRLLYLTFYGAPRDPHRFEHAHESPAVMTFPLIVLAILAVVSAGWPIPFFGGHKLPALLAPPPPLATLAIQAPVHEAAESGWLAFAVFVISIGVLIAGYALYKKTYKQRNPGPEHYATKYAGLYDTIRHLYWFDEFYQATVVRLGDVGARVLRAFDIYVVDATVNAVGLVGVGLAKVNGLIDKYVVDGFVNLFWRVSHLLSRLFRRLQTGNLQDYLAFAVGGIAFVSLIFLLLSS